MKHSGRGRVAVGVHGVVSVQTDRAVLRRSDEEAIVGIERGDGLSGVFDEVRLDAGKRQCWQDADEEVVTAREQSAVAFEERQKEGSQRQLEIIGLMAVDGGHESTHSTPAFLGAWMQYVGPE